MKTYVEKPLKDFNFWGDAKPLTDLITDEEFERLEHEIFFDQEYVNEADVNDIFAYEEGDAIALCLGYESKQDLLEKRRRV